MQCVEQGASIPRVIVFIEKTSLPFIVYQKQFPIHVACGMTINKAQGQRLRKVGICLIKNVCTRSQLYVAFSQSMTLANI